MKRNGFTLIELVISIGLLAGLSVFSVSVVSSIIRSATKAQAAIDLEQTTNFVHLKIRNDLEQAYKVTVTNQTLTIYKGTTTDPVLINYWVGTDNACNSAANFASGTIKCLIRQEGSYAAVPITESSTLTDNNTRPSNSAVTIDQSGAYFSAVNDPLDATKVIAVNLMIKFSKPDAASAGQTTFRSVNNLNTTIVLPR